MKNFVIGRKPMTCGRDEAIQRSYRKVEGKSGVWLIPDIENSGDFLYFHDPKDTKSDGFGGATIEFPLVDGGVYKTKGPWHSNSEHCFSDSGEDHREKHRTFVVLSQERGHLPIESYKGGETVMRGVLYQDPEGGKVGHFYRWKELVKQHPEARYYYSESNGGSSCGPISPDPKNW